MSRLAIWNMLVGFALIFLAAAGGPFLAVDLTDSYLRDKTIASTWVFKLLSSAHGHTNLFGMLHVLFGLSVNYSNFPLRIKIFQSIGLAAGGFAMSFLMFARAFTGPEIGFDFLGILIGACLSASLCALAIHVIGLAMKLNRSRV